MKKLSGLIAMLALVGGVSLAGCKGGDKCTQAVDKAMGFAQEMATSMAKQMGGDADKAKLDEKMAEAKKEMEKQKPEAINKCNEALKNDKDGKLAGALDCMIAAKGMEDMAKCKGADELMK